MNRLRRIKPNVYTIVTDKSDGSMVNSIQEMKGLS